MAVQRSDLAEDKCYVTANGQVRRILKLDATEVRYEARGKEPKMAPWPNRATAKIDTFLSDVVDVVSCDHAPV
jgi:hypothetical protein